MNEQLYHVLNSIDDEYQNDILINARNYIEIDIGKQARALGYSELTNRYQKVYAIVPIKHPKKGMKVRIDGRTFVGYTKYGKGVVIPAYVAKDAGLPEDKYIPNDSMILNFV